MKPGLFFLYAAISVCGVAFALLPLRVDTSPKGSMKRWALYVVSGLALIPICISIVFFIFPCVPIRILPIEAYATLDREYLYPFLVIQFALASHLVMKPNRRALVLLTLVVAGWATWLGSWRLTTPAVYSSEATAASGVCYQSTGFTCGAAATVTLLERLGIPATEGEMARLSETIPKRGVSDFQAAAGLIRKLREAGYPATVRIRCCPASEIDEVPVPFLAGTRYSLWFEHMVCVDAVDSEVVRVADPLRGFVEYRRKEFDMIYCGTAITVERGGRE